MISNKPAVEWVFLAEEEQNRPWPPAPQDTTDHLEPRTGPRIRRTIWFTIVTVVFLVTGMGMAYARQEALQGVQAMEHNVHAVVEVEEWAQQHAPELLAHAMVDDSGSLYWQQTMEQERRVLAPVVGRTSAAPTLDIQDIRFAGGMATAEMTLVQPVLNGGAPVVYRQTRFYRETENGWLRTKPDPALWGAPQHLETARLVWRYRRRDQAVVAQIAGQMDALYADLLQDYGLAQPPEDQKLVVDVRVDYAPWLMSYDVLQSLGSNADPLQSFAVPSPSVYLVPAHLTDADVLGQAVALTLLKAVSEQATVQHGHDIGQAVSELNGLRLWQVWEMGLGLSAWRDDVLQWVYGNVTPDAEGAAIILPARYHELCAEHRWWMITPVTIGIPLYCDLTDGSPVRHQILLTNLNHTSLAGLKEMPRYPSEETAFRLLGRTLAMATVIDYVVATYGRERLPALVAALTRHDSWETLVLDVFGVSLDEFEQGWRQHVAGLTQCEGNSGCR